jgi:hypothetical protein
LVTLFVPVVLFAASAGAQKADGAARTRTIDHLDISGTAAMARATLVHGRTTFVDYFVLLEVDEQWRIANKVYSAAPTSNFQLPTPDASTTPDAVSRET